MRVITPPREPALPLALVIDDLAVPEIKTKQIVAIIKALKLKDTTLLIGTTSYDADKKPAYDMKLYKSARNIAGVEVLPVAQFNAYTVLKQKRLLLTKAALEELRAAGKKAE